MSAGGPDAAVATKQLGESLVRTFAREFNNNSASLGYRYDTSPFSYLAAACDQVHDLTEQMVSLAVHLGAHEVTAGWERPRWFPEEA